VWEALLRGTIDFIDSSNYIRANLINPLNPCSLIAERRFSRQQQIGTDLFFGSNGIRVNQFDLLNPFSVVLFFCHFLLAQKVTKKGTTPDSYRETNHLLGLIAKGFTPGLAEPVVRTFRGQPSRRCLQVFD
jgi:hypothetical protein